MSAQKWTVEVHGKKHVISAEQDAQRRVIVRLDGRMPVPPMRADEDEREIPVGDVRYVIRRKDDGFDLDVPPEVFLNRAIAASSAEKAKSKSGIGKWIGAVILIAVVAGLIRYGKYGLQYMRVSWQPYASADGTFKAKFPGTPKNSTQSQNINGDIWTVNSLYTEYKNHGYAVQYVDLKIVVVESNAESIMEQFFSGWIGAMGARVESKEKGSVARNPAINFAAWIPAGVGPADQKLEAPARIRGMIVLRDRRLFLVWTVAALGDPFANDLQQFLAAFETSAPPEHSAKLMVAAAEPEPAEKPVDPAVVAAQRKAAEAEELAAVNRREEIAKRRAAEPQIFLEREWKMYHVAGCRSVTPNMQQVAIELKPYDYAPHNCVPEEIRNWKRPAAVGGGGS